MLPVLTVQILHGPSHSLRSYNLSYKACRISCRCELVCGGHRCLFHLGGIIMRFSVPFNPEFDPSVRWNKTVLFNTDVSSSCSFLKLHVGAKLILCEFGLHSFTKFGCCNGLPSIDKTFQPKHHMSKNLAFYENLPSNAPSSANAVMCRSSTDVVMD